MASDVAGGCERVRWTFEKCHLINGHFTTTSGLFLETTWLSLTKLRFRRSFWGAGQVYILIGTKVMTQNPKTQKMQICVFVQNRIKTEMEIFAFFYISGHNFWINRPIKHLKMTVWTTALWKMKLHMAKKRPETVL